MAIVQSVRVIVGRTVNLGNYNSAKVEVSVEVGRDQEDDTPETMRAVAAEQAAKLLYDAYEEFIPKKRARSDDSEYR